MGLELPNAGDFSASGPYNKANSSLKEHLVLCVTSTSTAHLLVGCVGGLHIEMQAEQQRSLTFRGGDSH